MTFSVHHFLSTSANSIRYPATSNEPPLTAEEALALMKRLTSQRVGSHAYAIKIEQPITQAYDIEELEQLIQTTK